MKHYLNVCDVNGAEVEPVDVITFGSPCQDLSVAGKRAGLKHESNGDDETTRSGLFMEAVRIIKEMREQDEFRQLRSGRTNQHIRPRFAVWENVPGAFSSNKGEDFRIVLEELARIKEAEISIPMPEKGKWKQSGEIVGDGWSIAWRTLDAQYHGVPQRRRRIFLVADFADECAGEILFECQGLPGYHSQSREKGQGTSRDSSESIGRTSERECIGFDGYNQSAADNVSKAITSAATDSDHVPLVLQEEPIYCVDEGGGKSYCNVTENVSPTLTCTHRGEPVICDSVPYTTQIRKCIAFEPGLAKRDGAENRFVENCTPTIRANMGDNQTAVAYGICSYESNSMKSNNPHSGIYEADTARTLDLNSENPACNQGGICICEPVAFRKTAHPRTADEGQGWEEATVNDTLNIFDSGETRTPTLVCEPIIDGVIDAETEVYERKYKVRRLTPTECARLQGMPDMWCRLSQIDDMSDEDYEFWKQAHKTYAEINGKNYKEKTKQQMIAWYNKLQVDSAEYKAYRNGMALPCVRVPIHGIAKHGAKTMASLFDGIGGFPLAGLIDGIKTLWTSEIELFPIAVTMERFREYEKYGCFTFGCGGRFE